MGANKNGQHIMCSVICTIWPSDNRCIRIIILNLLRNRYASHASRRAGSSSSSRPSRPKDFSLILSAM